MVKKAFKDIKLSRLGMGNMRLPLIGKPDSGDKIDYPKAHAILDKALASGINYFDTAHIYNGGDSESCLGEWIKKQDRSSFYLATKYNVGVTSDYAGMFEAQLKRLQTDHIDFFLIHCLTDDNIEKYMTNGCIDYFEEQRRKGRITYLGFSSHASPETLAKFADFHKWDFAQLQINYYDWLYEKTKEEYEVLASRNIPIVVMEPLRGGKLANISKEAREVLDKVHPEWNDASWGFRFVASLPAVQVILSGMSTLEQLEDNLKTFDKEEAFTKEDEKTLFEAAEVFRKNIYVPCTACRYCVDNCPKQIDIPAYLRILNLSKIDDWWRDEIKNVKSVGKPADCIKCGACMGHCPQNIKIPDYIAEMADIMKQNNM